MAIEEDSGCDIPEWVVTFGDMMSLLLTFFIMLVSLSEIKEEDLYQAMVQSMKRQFGHEAARLSMVPGKIRPRNSAIMNVATMGRAKRQDTMKGGDKVKAPVGEHRRVLIVRPGTKTAIGTVVYFDEGTTEVGDVQRTILQQHFHVIQGKPQKGELRGHTTHKPVSPSSTLRDHWDLAYQRTRNVMQYLVRDLKLDPKRIRLSVAGPNEPAHIGTDPKKLRNNPRVEVYLLDEVVSDSIGTNEELRSRFIDDPKSK